MSHKKAGGSTSNNRDSNAQRLGVKLYSGEIAKAGNIIIRQRGSKFFPGKGVMKGSDDTIFATVTGVISFTRRMARKFTGKLMERTFVNVTPVEKK